MAMTRLLMTTPYFDVGATCLVKSTASDTRSDILQRVQAQFAGQGRGERGSPQWGCDAPKVSFWSENEIDFDHCAWSES